MHPILAALPADILNKILVVKPQLRTKEMSDSAVHKADDLRTAAEKRVKDIGTKEAQGRNKINITPNTPTGDLPKDLRQLNLYATHTPAFDPTDPNYAKLNLANTRQLGSKININPNAPAEYLAHELGHHVTNSTEMGHKIRNLRTGLAQNKKLATALGIAAGGLGLPAIQASLQEGDDDLLEGIAISSLFAAPTLIDEALASKNALAIMEDAGIKANLGQRARLAGALLSYASAPIMAGMVGNVIGNVADDYTAIYDL